MFKKRLAFFLTAFTYALLLGHNLIPHHHHDIGHELAEHHQANHHHDDEREDEDEGLGDIFSYFFHPAEGFIFTNAYNISNTFSKQLLSIVAVLPDNFSPDKLLIPPLLCNPPAEQLIYISPHSLSPGLRAPPVC